MSSRAVPCRACEGTGVVEEYPNPNYPGPQPIMRVPCAMCHRDAAIATDIDIYALGVILYESITGRRGVK